MGQSGDDAAQKGWPKLKNELTESATMLLFKITVPF